MFGNKIVNNKKGVKIFLAEDSDCIDLTGKLVGVIQNLSALLTHVPDEYKESVCIDFMTEDGYEGHTAIYDIYYTRLETDEEFQERKDSEKQLYDDVLEKEKNTYLQLKKKFEG